MSTTLRRTGGRLAWVLGLTAGLSLLVIPTAGAYLDPGSGSIIFQAVIAGAMASSLAIKIFWRRLTVFFGRLFGSSGPTQADAAEDDAEADQPAPADHGPTEDEQPVEQQP